MVADTDVSRNWYVEVLGASVHGQYGTSVVLELLGDWLLLVGGGGPTPDKPTVTFAPPVDPDRVSAQLVFRVEDCRATPELLSASGATFPTEPVDRGGRGPGVPPGSRRPPVRDQRTDLIRPEPWLRSVLEP